MPRAATAGSIGRVTSPAADRYRVLSPAEVAAVLPALPGWTGDTRRLVCTAVVRDPDALLAELAAVEAELDHHAAVERTSSGVTFTVWTHVRDAVTPADVELAERIGALVAQASR